MMRYGYGNNMMGGWSGLLFIILIGIVLFLFYRKRQNNDVGTRDNSLNILNERFARGEINEEEYNQRKDVLSRNK